jgi:hypothetical protein
MESHQEDSIMVYVTYDSASPYPQDAKFGLGVTSADGTHSPPAGLSSFAVNDVELIHGLDERLYDVTAADTLTPKSQQDVDDIKLAEYKKEAEGIADAEAERRISLAEANPAVGQNLDENGRIRNTRRRNNKAKRKVNSITDADDHLLDHIDLIYDSLDLRLDAIENAADFAAVEAIINDISNDIHWPAWSPI